MCWIELSVAFLIHRLLNSNISLLYTSSKKNELLVDKVLPNV